MSKNKRSSSGRTKSGAVLSVLPTEETSSNNHQSVESNEAYSENNAIGGNAVSRIARLKKHWWAVGIIALLSLGTFGAGLKYLDDSAKQEKAANAQLPLREQNQSLLSKVNPFVEPPLPSATPQLSKEYIYAGSRMLAVEDANANAAPPADLAVWRPSTGFWYVLGGQGSQQTSFQWGGSSDLTVPGDYDGDGKTDFSVFRPSTGYWYVVRSSDSASIAYAFGQSGDKPVAADYDGDGKTDAAVFRPSTGWWYIQKSSDSSVAGYNFGISTDTPAPADYDGDGKADLSIWRPGDATFYTLKSGGNYATSETATFPQTSSQIVSGDYDGDGRADYAIRYNNTWMIRTSSTGTIPTPVSWHSGGDKEVQNDYDGDGRVDIAVWEAATGNWYIRQSSHLGQANELRQEQWGAPTDIPVPAFYRR